MRKGFSGLSELLSALILLGVSIAIAFLLVYALPTVSPPGVRPWLRPTLIAAFKQDSKTAVIYLYNPHSEQVKVVEAWSGGERAKSIQSNPDSIPPRGYAEVVVEFDSDISSSILLHFDSGAWMEIRF